MHDGSLTVRIPQPSHHEEYWINALVGEKVSNCRKESVKKSAALNQTHRFRDRFGHLRFRQS